VDDGRRAFFLLAALLLVVIGYLFRDSFRPEMATFANDGPLGAMMAKCFQLPEAWKGMWADLNWIGGTGGVAPMDFTWLVNWALGPLYFIKFYPGITLVALGFSVWLFFRQLQFPPAVCLLGGLAGTLNSDFFSYACWGLGTLPLCVASVFLALAALSSSWKPSWTRPVLAGAALGSALMEGFDNGAIFSLYVAAFAIFQAWNSEPQKPASHRLSLGILRTAIVAAASALVAAHTLIGLVQGNITGAAGMGQDKASREARWWFSTMWSLPPTEALRTVIPGLYGYRMDTPDGGNYWGTAGSDPAWDEYFKNPNRKPEEAPQADIRFSGAGHYAGVLVVLLAAFGVVQSLRGKASPLTLTERRWVWFWAVAAFASLLFALGRYAPFYRIIYALPYFNTMRIPMKFLHPMNAALVVLCGYGLHALWRGWITQRTPVSNSPGNRSTPPRTTFTQSPEGRWVIGTAAVTGLAFLAWILYVKGRSQLIAFLGEVGFEGPAASAIAQFSQREVGLFVVFLGLSSVLVALLLARRFSGPRTHLAVIALGALLVVDLGRANTPWIVHYNWKDRFTSNPLFDFLKASPHTGRVVGTMPFALQGQAGRALQYLTSVVRLEWAQHQFRFFNIQILDIVQMPRMPADLAAYRQAVGPNPVREWELTNTRYLFALAPIVDLLNQQLDPAQKRFRLHTPFSLSQNPSGVFGVATNTEGPFALVEFTGALPRAMLFDRWRPEVPDDEALDLLVSTNFSPHSEVLIADPVPAPSVTTSTQPAGTATYESYTSRHFVIATDARTPCVLLVNDKYDPDWKVLVDGKPEPLLRANFIMRGVYLTPGQHKVEFVFEPSTRAFWFSTLAILASLGLLGFVLTRKESGPPTPA